MTVSINKETLGPSVQKSAAYDANSKTDPLTAVSSGPGSSMLVGRGLCVKFTLLRVPFYVLLRPLQLP